jgi:hypothetical protein
MTNEEMIKKYEGVRRQAINNAIARRQEAKRYDKIAKTAKEVVKKLKTAKVNFDGIYINTSGFHFSVSDHSQALKLCGALGSFVGRKWDKNVSYGGDTLRFEGKNLDGVEFSISGVKPGENCRIEYADVIIPAQPERIEKRPKIVCDVKQETIKVE